MPFAASWMELEIITLNEGSQTKTNMISFICGIYEKNNTIEVFYKTEITHRHRKSYDYQRGEDGRDKLGIWD